jgi:hypothetical protein
LAASAWGESPDGQLNGRRDGAGEPRLNREVNHLGPHIVALWISVDSQHALHHVGIINASIYRHDRMKSK